MLRSLLLLLIWIGLPSAAPAQGDLEAERASLQGISFFEVDVTLEGPQHLVKSDILRSDVLLHRIVHRLGEAGLDVRRVKREAAEDAPHLHLHLNLLELDRGLIPFAVSADFYQAVRLHEGRRDMEAVTWDESVLGLVSRDLLATIPESVDGLIDQFVEDYRNANSR